jgi:hypothetical protein
VSVVVLFAVLINEIVVLFKYLYCIQTFAIRFASSEIAQEYKAAFAKNQAEMQVLISGGDAKEGAAEAEQAAAALDSLAIKDNEGEAEKAKKDEN